MTEFGSKFAKGINEMNVVDFSGRYRLITWMRDIDFIGIRAFANFLPKILIPAPNSDVVVKTLYGFDLIIDPKFDSGVERSIYYTGTYEKGTLNIMHQLLKEGDVFLDVGANIGLMTIFASTCIGATGRTYAYEPNPNTREMLEKNISLNNASNVKVRPRAVGARSESGAIYEHPDNNRGRATLIKPQHRTISHEVSVVSLDDEFRANERVDMVKMDIEGFELEALKGMCKLLGRSMPPMLIVECSELRVNSFGVGTSQIYEHLKMHKNYRFFRTLKSKERLSRLREIKRAEDLPEHDNIYCMASGHIEKATARGLIASN